MAIADEIQQVTNELFHWSAFAPELKCELSSSAYLSKGSLVLIDPIQLTEEALQQLLKHGTPRAILLTNENHERSTDWYRRHFRIPVCVPSPCSRQLSLKPKAEVFVQETDVVYGLQPRFIPGATVGETAYWNGEGTLIVGDALVNLEPDGLALLPDKYCENAAQNRESLKNLLALPVQVATFAHGLPLRENVLSRLQALLN
jgi:glyoxylase-like metal-dependent hydrolase (beta-lactamase superfamily II)